jgi:hypothetical protein
MNQIKKWFNENRTTWFLGVISFAIGIRLGLHFFMNPNHIYTLHDILWGYHSEALPSLFSFLS